MIEYAVIGAPTHLNCDWARLLVTECDERSRHGRMLDLGGRG
jgi:hypothetical protein